MAEWGRDTHYHSPRFLFFIFCIYIISFFLPLPPPPSAIFIYKYVDIFFERAKKKKSYGEMFAWNNITYMYLPNDRISSRG